MSAEWVRSRTVKCSLSTLCLSKDNDVRPLLKEAIVYCNQLRVLVSVVAKHHMFSVLAANRDLGFDPDRTYYTHVKDMIVDGRPSEDLPYKASLQTSRDMVIGQIPAPVYTGPLNKGAISQIMSHMITLMADNLRKHITQHAFTCLQTWLTSQIRTRLPQADGDRWTTMAPDLKVRYDALSDELKAAWEPESTRIRLVSFMYRLRCDVDALATSTKRAIKLMAVIPQANIHLAAITLDTAVMAHVHRLVRPSCAVLRDIWSSLFRMDRINNLNPRGRFGLSIRTDGVTAMVSFDTLAPASGVNGPGLYPEGDLRGLPTTPGLVAIDPGLRTLITAVQLDNTKRKPFRVGHKEYIANSMRMYKTRKTTGQAYKRDMGRVKDRLSVAPSKRSIDNYDEYVTALAETWAATWVYHGRLKMRKIKFFVWSRRDSWMEKTTNRLRDYVAAGQPAGQTPMVLFGDGGKDCHHNKATGGGVKGPMRELKKRLATKIAVVECSEHRTSKLCLECGRPAQFFHHGVTYCTDQEHHRMQNRDVSAAYKIGARCLANAAGLDLGPWAKGSSVGAPSTVLRDVLSAYQKRT